MHEAGTNRYILCKFGDLHKKRRHILGTRLSIFWLFGVETVQDVVYDVSMFVTYTVSQGGHGQIYRVRRSFHEDHQEKRRRGGL